MNGRNMAANVQWLPDETKRLAAVVLGTLEPMPDTRSHRGAHPKDARDFGRDVHAVLEKACSELSWLLTRDYGMVAALTLVGDHHQLTARQRLAVMRGACGDQALRARLASRLAAESLVDAEIGIDGFNCLITLEAMFSGAPVFVGRDGVYRDLASVHGTYRRVQETLPALAALRDTLLRHRVGQAVFYLDRPVSNSGRLRALIEETFAGTLPTSVVLHDSVDPVLVRERPIVASSDSWVIDHAQHWLDLPALVAETYGLSLNRVPLGAA